MGVSRAYELAGGKAAGLEQIRNWIGWRVDDLNGGGLGRLESVIPTPDGRAPMWLVINEFRFGRGRRFIAPARDAIGSSGRVWLPYEAERVRGSVGLGAAVHTPQAERRLLAYWRDQRQAA